MKRAREEEKLQEPPKLRKVEEIVTSFKKFSTVCSFCAKEQDNNMVKDGKGGVHHRKCHHESNRIARGMKIEKEHSEAVKTCVEWYINPHCVNCKKITGKLINCKQCNSLVHKECMEGKDLCCLHACNKCRLVGVINKELLDTKCKLCQKKFCKIHQAWSKDGHCAECQAKISHNKLDVCKMQKVIDEMKKYPLRMESVQPDDIAKLEMRVESDKLHLLAEEATSQPLPHCVLCNIKDGPLRKCTDCGNAMHTTHQEKKCGKCATNVATVLPSCILCFKKDGELLVCPVKGCRSVVHKECMVDDKCPCHYCVECMKKGLMIPSEKRICNLPPGCEKRDSCYYCGFGYCIDHWSGYSKEEPECCQRCAKFFSN